MTNYRKVFDVLVGILIKAGYDLTGKGLNHDLILAALSDYQKKHDEMLEHILMQ